MTHYKSKRDGWLVALLMGTAAFAMWGAFALLSNEDVMDWLSALLLLLIGAALPLWVLLRTHYVLDAQHLHIYSGPFAWRIPLAEITEVRPTWNPLSSPALSLDRLRIERHKGLGVMISPENKAGFLSDLATKREIAVKIHLT